MDHTMHLHQHQQCCNQPDAATANGTRTSAGVGVSQVAFVLAAVAFLSMFSSSSLGGASSSSSLPSGAALSARLTALCSFVMTKKALFVLSNAIFLFLAADCRCFFSGVCSMATPSTTDDVVTASELLPCAVQARPCASYSGNLCYCCSNTKSASADCSAAEQGVKREDVPAAASPPESARLDGDEANTVTLEKEATCGGVAEEELEKLEMDELNRKFEDFIQSRRSRWLKEEEQQVLQCQQQEVV